MCDVEDPVCGALQGAMIGAWQPREADVALAVGANANGPAEGWWKKNNGGLQ